MSFKTAMMTLTITLICAAASPCWAAEEPSMSVDFEVFQGSKYVWRGIVYNNEPVLQPSLTASWKSGLSLNLWGNFDETDFGDCKGRCNELDYTIGYDWESGGKELSIGYSVYTYPNTEFAGTSEILASCGFGGSLSPALSLAWDVDQARGLYLNLGLARSVPLGSRSLEISGGLGFADKRVSNYYYGVPSAGLADASVCVEVPIESRGGWTITPSVAYTRLIRQSVRESMGRPDNFIFGVKLAKTF